MNSPLPSTLPKTGIIELEKNDITRIRIARTTYRNHEFIDIRTYVKNLDTCEFIPTKKGVTLSPDQIPTFIDGLKRIQAEGGEG